MFTIPGETSVYEMELLTVTVAGTAPPYARVVNATRTNALESSVYAVREASDHEMICSGGRVDHDELGET